MEENEIIQKIKEITDEYSKKLRELDKTTESVSRAISYLDKKRSLLLGLSTEEPSEEERRKGEPAFLLMEEYKNAIKAFFKQNNLLLTSVRSSSPKEYPSGIIPLSRGLRTQFDEEVGDFFFASSTNIKRNAYPLRLNASGMLQVADDIYLFPYASFNPVNGRLILPKPSYIYYMKSDEFTPVVTIRHDKNKEPCFYFGDEWTIPRDINIAKDVVDIKEYRDASTLLSNIQVISSSDEETISQLRRIYRERKPIKESFIVLANAVINGKAQYWNDILRTNSKYGNLLRRLKEENIDMGEAFEQMDAADFFEEH
jgi:hypothetical protein